MVVLAVFAGLPGVGKSTLAEQVGTVLPAAVLPVDTVDFTMAAYDVTESRPGYAAYGVVAALAEVQLRMGHSVIIDAVHPVKAARQQWVELAERLDVPLRVVEVLCGDDAEHRRRVEARYAAHAHPTAPPATLNRTKGAHPTTPPATLNRTKGAIPDWVRVVERQAEYEPYLGPRLVVDTFLAKDPVGPVVDYLSLRTS